MTIVGVSAAGFAGIDPVRSPQIRVPILMKPVMLPDCEWLGISDRRARWVQVFARLKPGYTVERAQGPLQGLFTQIRQYETTLPAAKDWSAYSRQQFMKGRLLVEQAAMGYSGVRNDFSTALMVLMCMVGLVLLIACANVANLLIARAFMRQKEIAVRLSLGASRGRLVRQLLVESLVLSVIGGVAGVFLAVALTRGLLAARPVGGIAAPDSCRAGSAHSRLHARADLRHRTRVRAHARAAGEPARSVDRAEGHDRFDCGRRRVALPAQGPRDGAGRAQLPAALRRRIVRAQPAEPEDAPTPDVALDNLVTFQLSPALSGYDKLRADELLPIAAGAPPVGARRPVGRTGGGADLLSGDEWDSSTSVEGHKPADGEDMQAFMNALSPGYFATMKIPILEGRDFTLNDPLPWDNVETTTPKVAIVNRQIRHSTSSRATAPSASESAGAPARTRSSTSQIVGVVADSLYEGPREGVHRQVFVPHHGNGSSVFYMRTHTGSAAAYGMIRNEVRQLDAAMPVYALKTLEGQLDETLLTDRLVAMLAAGFGFLAMLLASIGLYGVMAFVVARRTKELGIRMALGARPGSVVWLVMQEVLILLAIGLAVGIPSAMALGQLVSTQLYGIQPHDPVIAVATMVLLSAVSAAAGLIPARRASRIDPIFALHYE